MEKFKFDTIVSHVRNSGFLFQGSEIYGGLANTWDYGPLGVELKNNVKKMWMKKFVQELVPTYTIDQRDSVAEALGEVEVPSKPVTKGKAKKKKDERDAVLYEV